MIGGIAAKPPGWARRRAAGVVVVTLVGLAMLGITSTAHAATAARACTSPYPPSLAVTDSPLGPDVPPLPGTNSARPIFSDHPPTLDSDGDGRPDHIGPVSGHPGGIQITGSHGVLRLIRPGVPLRYGGSVGDLNQDGRDEFTVIVPVPNAQFAESAEYLIPGGVAPGTYDPATIGIRIPTGLTTAVADRTGDGVPDLVQADVEPDSAYPGITRVLSGATVIATEPGAAAPASAVVQTIDGFPSAVADLGDAKRPAIITGDVLGGSATSAPTSILVRVAPTSGPVREFGAKYVPASPGSGSYDPLGSVDLRVTASGTFLILGQDGTREGDETYIWRLDDPCGPLPATATTTTTVLLPAVDADRGCGPPLAPDRTGVDLTPSTGTPPGVDGSVAFWAPQYALVDPYDHIRFAVPGQESARADNIGRFDLNGDGHPDFLVVVGSGLLGDGGVDYAVSGTLRPGTYDPVKVGVRLPDAWKNSDIEPVGDQNGDGGDDIAVGNHLVFSGRDLLAPGPGGVADPKPLADLDGVISSGPPVGVADLGDGKASLIWIHQIDATTAIIHVGLDGRELTTAGQPLTTAVGNRPEVMVTTSTAGPVVSYEQAGPGPRAATYWVWTLNHRCPAGSSPSTTPAFAMHQPATFTG